MTIAAVLLRPFRLARVLFAFLRRQLAQVHFALRRGTIPQPFDAWTPTMVEACLPLVAPYYQRGGRSMMARLARRRRRKDTQSPSLIFNLLHPRVADALSRLVFNFCDETNRTSTMKLHQAFAALRRELQAGLEQGEANDRLAVRVGHIFADPGRAYTIARTEASRAVHTGQFIAAKESGIVKGKKWLAKSDACPRCRALAGKVVALEEDFGYDAGAGAYAHVLHPPLHPHCTCTWSEEL